MATRDGVVAIGLMRLKAGETATMSFEKPITRHKLLNKESLYLLNTNTRPWPYSLPSYVN